MMQPGVILIDQDVSLSLFSCVWCAYGMYLALVPRYLLSCLPGYRRPNGASSACWGGVCARVRVAG